MYLTIILGLFFLSCSNSNSDRDYFIQSFKKELNVDVPHNFSVLSSKHGFAIGDSYKDVKIQYDAQNFDLFVNAFHKDSVKYMEKTGCYQKNISVNETFDICIDPKKFTVFLSYTEI